MYLCLLGYIFVLATQPTNGGFVGTDNFIVRSVSRKLFEEGLRNRQGGNYEAAFLKYQQSYQFCPLQITALEMAKCCRGLARWDGIETWTNTAARINYDYNSAFQSEDSLRRSRVCYQEGDIGCAIRYASMARQQDPRNAYATYMAGVYLQQTGDTFGAIEAYLAAIHISPNFVQARINVAAMFQGVNDLPESIRHYRHLIDSVFLPADVGTDLYCMSKANLGVAYFQSKQQGKAMKELKDLCSSLIDAIITHCPTARSRYPWMQHGRRPAVEIAAAVSETEEACDEYVSNLGVAMQHLATVKKSICDWRDMELDIFGFLYPASMHNYEMMKSGLRQSAFGPLLPFDSLLLPINVADRLKIAYIRSHTLQLSAPALDSSKTVGNVLSMKNEMNKSAQRNRKLKLGFLSYDFNDHPTAHLVEALFQTIVKCRLSGAMHPMLCDDVHMGILNFGPNDNSEYRRRLEATADSMYDIAVESHLVTAQRIQRNRIDILLDMQLHTLGNRAEMVAAHPAPLVVNYLVYPGTCGSSQHEYIIADKIVVPPEVIYAFIFMNQ